MLGHFAQDLLVRRVFAETEGGVLGLAAADDVDGANTEQLHDAPELIDGERFLQVLAHRQFDPRILNQGERRAALVAAGIVQKDVSHERRIPRTCYASEMPVTVDFREFVLEQLGRVVAIDWKRMFGGVGLYADGTFFALIDDDIVYFKVGDQNRADFEAAGARAFSPYKDGRSSMTYFELPADVLEDIDALRSWTGKSVEVARSAAVSKRKAPAGPRSRKRQNRS